LSLSERTMRYVNKRKKYATNVMSLANSSDSKIAFILMDEEVERSFPMSVQFQSVKGHPTTEEEKTDVFNAWGVNRVDMTFVADFAGELKAILSPQRQGLDTALRKFGLELAVSYHYDGSVVRNVSEGHSTIEFYVSRIRGFVPVEQAEKLLAQLLPQFFVE